MGGVVDLVTGISLSDILSLLALLIAIGFGLYNIWLTNETFKASKYPSIKVETSNKDGEFILSIKNLSNETTISALNGDYYLVWRLKFWKWRIPFRRIFYGLATFQEPLEPKQKVDVIPYYRFDKNSNYSGPFVMISSESLADQLQSGFSLTKEEVLKHVWKRDVIFEARLRYKPGFWKAKDIKLVIRRQIYDMKQEGLMILQHTDEGLDTHRLPI